MRGKARHVDVPHPAGPRWEHPEPVSILEPTVSVNLSVHMRLAVLADIHGNLPALEAVCATLSTLDPDYVVVDGDLINAVPFSPQVVARIRATDWCVVRGNHEFYLLDYGTERAPGNHGDPERWALARWLAETMPREHALYLAALPDDCTLYFPDTQPVRVAHGTPGHNRRGFFPAMSAEQILAQVREIPQRTLISAHTHVQMDRHVSLVESLDPLGDPHGEAYQAMDGYHPERCHPARHWHVINPGSVGLPLNGDPRAQFAIMESVPEEVEPGGWQVTHYRIEYDRRPALQAYYDSGMLAAGGPIARLFYWELVTAEPEIIRFYRWCRRHDLDPDAAVEAAFQAYVAATGRDAYVRTRDPLGKAGTLP